MRTARYTLLDLQRNEGILEKQPESEPLLLGLVNIENGHRILKSFCFCIVK